MLAESKVSGIVLYAKRRGPTSFNSLNQIKKTLETKKVGHTGTLDSFAEGLLVVMVGSLTRLASHITAFDKKYEAIIAFGSETDTLDPFGDVITTKNLPLIEDFTKSFQSFIGKIDQFPPQYSAIHINGKRASDIARSGKDVDMPSRTVEIFSSSIDEIKLIDNRVAYAKVSFHVSKGTYIRSLARDIAQHCNSCAHLIALRRTAVGSFSLHDAVGYDDMEDFTIERAVRNIESSKEPEKLLLTLERAQKIKDNLKKMTIPLAKECGMETVVLKNDYEFHFFNGKPLKKKMFNYIDIQEKEYAVFTQLDVFVGVIHYDFSHEKNTLRYSFVIHHNM